MPLDPHFLWAWPIAALFLGTLIHEDVAILSGAYLVAHETAPAAIVLPTLLLGVVAGDFSIYGIGAIARRAAAKRKWAWLQRRVAGGVNAQIQAWLDRNLFVTVASCRVLPMALFPVFGTCGWLGVPFRRFAVPVIVSAALYVPLMFALFELFGAGLSRSLDDWGWVLAGGILLLAFLLRRRFGPSRLARRLRAAAPGLAEPHPPAAAAFTSHPGMPPLRHAQIRVPLSERINEPLFYVPLVAQWLYLGARHGSLTLPTVANPLIEAGGLLGESKHRYFAMAGNEARRWLARTACVERPANADADTLTRAESAMAAAAIDYPIVAKPDIAWRGYGCRLIADRAALTAYIDAFPRSESLLLQEYVAHHGEAGVFYVRLPGDACGQITSLTYRYYPFVVGDGHSTLAELIRSDPRLARKAKQHLAAHRARLHEVPAHGETVRLALVGSNRVGGLYVNATQRVTQALEARFDAIAASIPEFYFGRFDVRFAGVDEFLAGAGFVILEINGAGAEAIHVWDPEYRLRDVYRDLFRQQTVLFSIGAANRARGFKPMRVRALVRCQRHQYRLNTAYPPSG